MEADTTKSPIYFQKQKSQNQLYKTKREIIFTSVVESNIPYWLNVILEGMGASRIQEIPYFNSTISAACYQMRSFGMETNP